MKRQRTPTSQKESKAEKKFKLNQAVEIGTEYKLPSRCLNDFYIKALLGTGSYGFVTQVCDKRDNCKYALKAIPLILGFMNKLFEDEVKYTKLFGDLGISPKFHKSWICEKVEGFREGKTVSVGFILTDKYDMTLKDLKEQEPEIFKEDKPMIKRELEDNLTTMNEGEYWPDDLHDENIMVKIKRGHVIDVVLIDFGRVIKDKKTAQEIKTQVEMIIKE